ncbi:MAG: hypothetical protein U5L01_10915 [Rheinheimera sp.]|nr:hypothetical protein [Rheinheimera sp.]
MKYLLVLALMFSCNVFAQSTDETGAKHTFVDENSLIKSPPVEECRIAHTGLPFCTPKATDCLADDKAVACGGKATYCREAKNGAVACGDEAIYCHKSKTGEVACGASASLCEITKTAAACGGLADHCTSTESGAVACGGLATTCVTGKTGLKSCGGKSTECAAANRKDKKYKDILCPWLFD